MRDFVDNSLKGNNNVLTVYIPKMGNGNLPLVNVLIEQMKQHTHCPKRLGIIALVMSRSITNDYTNVSSLVVAYCNAYGHATEYYSYPFVEPTGVSECRVKWSTQPVYDLFLDKYTEDDYDPNVVVFDANDESDDDDDEIVRKPKDIFIHKNKPKDKKIVIIDANK